MKVTVKLGSSLRSKAPHFVGGEGTVELAGPGPVSVREVMGALGIGEEEVNLIYRNHRLAATTASVVDGDRLGLFPPNFIHFSQFYLKRDEE
ncbi:MAG: MoaD/ThiS family protein [Thermoleophilia bacterium]